MENKDCCGKPSKKGKGILSGIFYGLIPHTGCIAFLIFAILGVTTVTALFRPMLMSPFFFYILIGLSVVFACISAGIYLKRQNMLSVTGIKRKWKYLVVLFGTTIGINILLFIFIFPVAANMVVDETPTGNFAAMQLEEFTLKVDIPCSGHASLITQELYTLDGVTNVKYILPNIYDITYDTTLTSEEEIQSLGIFDTYACETV